MRPRRAHRSSGLLRSLTLLRTFLVASAAILAVGAVVLSSMLSTELRELALEDNARDVSLFVDTVLTPAVVRGDRVVATRSALRRLARTVGRPRDVRGVSVWSRGGRLVFSTSRPKQVGRRLPIPSEARAAMRTHTPQAALVDRAGSSPTLVVVWSPVLSSRERVVGVTEVALDEAVLDEATAGFGRTIWLAVAAVLGVLWLALAVLVRGASWRLRRQNDDLESRSRDLLASTRQLEQTLLETIATLNAAVEARDPYTAGHSQRVRRVALAIGRELNLPARQLGALATAAVFHDIGKIGMPDAILTKPDTLSPSESAIMREHVIRGAEIVSRIASFHDSVPAVRHHHERWDGLGYPDGLAGEEAPLEAAIIALADAWDAMTTERPYASALELHDALREIREGRGKHFNPAVVDAFLVVARRRPADVLPPDAPSPFPAVVVA
jgi:putative nucleotidyltransferase with HDIG domain